MRVLILSALLACAAAAPSEIVAPLIKSEIIAPVAAVPVAKIASVDPGDIEAAAIDAKVAADDAAIAAADKARLLTDLAVENANDNTQVVADLVKEKQEEAFWSVEDQKWRYLDAVKTAEAKLDGAIARDAPIISRSAFGGVIPAPIIAPAPIVAPVTPILAQRAPLLTPIVYSAPAILKAEDKMEEKKDEMKYEMIVKSAELMSEELKAKIAALQKNLESKPAVFAPTLFAAPIVAPYKLSEPWLTQVYVPGAAYSAYSLPSPLLPSAVKVA